jgi:hypothetical protein
MAERRHKVRGPQPEKLLSYIQAVSMLRGKTPGRRNTFYVSQQQKSGGDGK